MDFEQEHNLESKKESLQNRGYFGLKLLARKYGYAKDHLGLLARTGKVKAIQFGNRHEWFIHEGSLKDYLGEIKEIPRSQSQPY